MRLPVETPGPQVRLSARFQSPRFDSSLNDVPILPMKATRGSVPWAVALLLLMGTATAGTLCVSGAAREFLWESVDISVHSGVFSRCLSRRHSLPRNALGSVPSLEILL